ncbi:MAG: nodulation protein NfeD [Gammaproteobacteria bacterium]|nr:MAG: nodulation protein NfeD [Gammaproteobacteria bacterium]
MLGLTVLLGLGSDGRSGGQVWVVDLDGPLGPATADLIIRSIEGAEEAQAEALVIVVDTPGGLDKSMRELVQAILAARVPVITYVAPNGARAASAGTYIAYASHIAAMAPATNIGSSTPVSIAPTPSMPTPTDGQEDTEPPPADAMTRKVVNDAVAYLQGLAELRGRNIDWAEETVRTGANVRASEAVAAGIVDLIADDLPGLLEAVDGWEVALQDGVATLETAGAGVYRVEADWKHELLELITDPTIAYGLLIFGIYGLILEFYNPGMIFPSVIGVVCLLLGAYGLQMLPVNYAALALIFVGIGMMVAEVFTPTMGVLGVGGVVAFVMGSLMLLDTESPEFGLPIAVIAAFAVSTAGLSLFAVGAAVRARAAAVRTGKESMIGAEVEVLDAFTDSGRVRAFGEIWQARAIAPVATGERANVVDLDGLILVISPKDGAGNGAGNEQEN